MNGKAFLFNYLLGKENTTQLHWLKHMILKDEKYAKRPPHGTPKCASNNNCHVPRKTNP
jgi:hypothetical protein